MRLNITINGLEQVQQELRFSARRMGAVAAQALTRTALDVKAAQVAEMRRVFDRPTPYTLNSVFVRPATADRAYAEVWLKDETAGSGTPATKYLLPQVMGGDRRQKRFEAALQAAGHLPSGWMVVPGVGARLDAYGNISKGQIIQVLSQLRITMTAGYTRNMAFEPRKQISAQRKAGGRFFVMRPGKGAAPGVYIRDLYQRTITPIFIFVNRATYRARYDFHGVAASVVADRLPVHTAQAIEQHLQRMRASQK